MKFSVTCYLELHIIVSFHYKCNYYFFQMKLLMFYIVQTTNFTFVGKLGDIQSIGIV